MNATASEPPEHAQAPQLAEQAHNDVELVDLWLHGKAALTQKAYRADWAMLAADVQKPLRQVTVGDLQHFVSSLAQLAPASQCRKIAATKSLFSYALRIGYVQFDAASALTVPKLKDRLSERIISEAQVQRLLELEPSARNNALLRVVYFSGLRISEACSLTWRDLRGTKEGGVATVFGKGGKTRAVIIPPKLWRTLAALRRGATEDAPLFRSMKGGALDPSAVHRIVKAAVKRAGLPAEMSCHWLRHGHASHATDHGCPPHELQASLGHASLATTTRYVHARPGTGSAKYLPE